MAKGKTEWPTLGYIYPTIPEHEKMYLHVEKGIIIKTARFCMMSFFFVNMWGISGYIMKHPESFSGWELLAAWAVLAISGIYGMNALVSIFFPGTDEATA